MAQKQTREKLTTLSLDISVLISHLRADRFVEETDSFLRRAAGNKTQLVIPEVVYAELYTGIFLASDPKKPKKPESRAFWESTELKSGPLGR